MIFEFRIHTPLFTYQTGEVIVEAASREEARELLRLQMEKDNQTDFWDHSYKGDIPWLLSATKPEENSDMEPRNDIMLADIFWQIDDPDEIGEATEYAGMRQPEGIWQLTAFQWSRGFGFNSLVITPLGGFCANSGSNGVLLARPVSNLPVTVDLDIDPRVGQRFSYIGIWEITFVHENPK